MQQALAFCQALEAGGGVVEGGVTLAKSKADLPGTVRRVVIEAGAGDDSDADLFHQVLCKGEVVRETETGNVGHDVVGPARHEAEEAGKSKVAAVCSSPATGKLLE